MKISSADLDRLLKIVPGKAEHENKIGVKKSPEEASSTNIKKWPRSLIG